MRCLQLTIFLIVMQGKQNQNEYMRDTTCVILIIYTFLKTLSTAKANLLRIFLI